MRISFILIFVVVFQLAALDADAQKAKVSITKSVLPLRELITVIEKQTDYLFVYEDAEVNLSEQVRVSSGKKSVHDVLDQAFSNGTITYEFANNYISLRNLSREEQKLIQQQEKKKITGNVIDADGEPVIGANVIEKGTTNGVITDIDGNFSLNVLEDAILKVSYIGYQPQEVPVGSREEFTIRLLDDF